MDGEWAMDAAGASDREEGADLPSAAVADVDADRWQGRVMGLLVVVARSVWGAAEDGDEAGSWPSSSGGGCCDRLARDRGHRIVAGPRDGRELLTKIYGWWSSCLSMGSCAAGSWDRWIERDGWTILARSWLAHVMGVSCWTVWPSWVTGRRRCRWAGLGKMMEHHTGAPYSGGVPYMVYLQM
ncbi:hypothetical protein ACLOJK_022015 [Asimina triloba]